MRPLNPNFCFTVKLNNRHIGGEFQYMNRPAGFIKLQLRGLGTRSDAKRHPAELTSFLRLIDGRWLIWNIQTNSPMQPRQSDEAIYAAFREAYSLAMIED